MPRSLDYGSKGEESLVRELNLDSGLLSRCCTSREGRHNSLSEKMLLFCISSFTLQDMKVFDEEAVGSTYSVYR
jgi:hypothetical protein